MKNACFFSVTPPILSSFESRNYRHGQSRPKSAAAAGVAPFRPSYCDLDKKVLRFFAHFAEDFGGHGLTSEAASVRRVRHVHLLYFLEDDTISVVEPRIKVGSVADSFCHDETFLMFNRVEIYYIHTR